MSRLKRRGDADVSAVPPMRKLVVDAAGSGIRRHAMYGLVEFDVTAPLEMIAEDAKNRENRLSFTGFIIANVAQLVAGDPSLQGLIDPLGRMVTFRSVDVMVLAETTIDGTTQGTAHILRGAERKTVRDITEEIRRIQHHPESTKTAGLIRMAERVPRWLRRLAFRLIDVSPRLSKRFKGTIAVSAVGMFGEGGGWGVAGLHHPLALTIGGISTRPVIRDGVVESCRMLHVTIGFDHDVVDGAPAARFAEALRRAVEAGAGLPQSTST